MTTEYDQQVTCSARIEAIQGIVEVFEAHKAVMLECLAQDEPATLDTHSDVATQAIKSLEALGATEDQMPETFAIEKPPVREGGF